MIYKIDGTNIASFFNVIPSPDYSMGIALSGFLDMPSRKGNTEYDWGTEIEPFTSASDLAYNERTITLQAYAKGNTNSALKSLISALKSVLVSSERILTVHTNGGTFVSSHTVYFTGGIQTVKQSLTEAVIRIEFTEPNIIFAESLGTAVNSGYTLNGYSLYANFGILPQTLPDYLGVPARIEVKTTEFYKNCLYSGARDLTFQCMMCAGNVQNLFTQMKRFHRLLSTAGLLPFVIPNRGTFYVYCKDGFKVEKIFTGSVCYALFTLKLREPQTN